MNGVFYIYCYENQINKKVYIGQTDNMERRDKEHTFHGHKTVALDCAIKKYGRENFSLDIVLIVESAEQADQEEIYWIARMREFMGKENVYNILDGGHGSRGRPVSEETRRKISKANTGKRHSPEARAKMSAFRKDKKLSPESIKKLSESLKGHKVSQETRDKIAKKRLGTKASEETKRKMSKDRKGKKHKPHSEEAKQKMSTSHMGKIISEEAKRKMSQNHASKKPGFVSPRLGKSISQETRDKLAKINNRAQLNEAQVKEIRSLYASGNFTSRQLAKRFDVGKTTILRILNNKTWRHLEYEQCDLVTNVLHQNSDGQFINRPRSETHHSSKLNINLAKEIRELYTTGQYTFKQLGIMFGVGASTIGRVIRNELWQEKLDV